MATAEAKAALSDCFKKSRVSEAMVKFIESVGVETLDDFANYVRRDRYEEDLKELQARGPEQLREMDPGQPGALAQSRLRAAYLLAVDLLKRSATKSHDALADDPCAPLPQSVRDQLTAAWAQPHRPRCRSNSGPRMRWWLESTGSSREVRRQSSTFTSAELLSTHARPLKRSVTSLVRACRSRWALRTARKPEA